MRRLAILAAVLLGASVAFSQSAIEQWSGGACTVSSGAASLSTQGGVCYFNWNSSSTDEAFTPPISIKGTALFSFDPDTQTVCASGTTCTDVAVIEVWQCDTPPTNQFSTSASAVCGPIYPDIDGGGITSTDQQKGTMNGDVGLNNNRGRWWFDTGIYQFRLKTVPASGDVARISVTLTQTAD